jgi:hypothetical protein
MPLETKYSKDFHRILWWLLPGSGSTTLVGKCCGFGNGRLLPFCSVISFSDEHQGPSRSCKKQQFYGAGAIWRCGSSPDPNSLHRNNLQYNWIGGGQGERPELHLKSFSIARALKKLCNMFFMATLSIQIDI